VTQNLVEVMDLTKHFPLPQALSDVLRGRPKEVIHAVDGVSLAIRPGETLGLIGESGSGKTTLGWLIVRLHEPTSGMIRVEGRDVSRLQGRDLRLLRREIQVVFQDPVGSLDPRLRAWQIVGEPLRAQEPLPRAKIRERVAIERPGPISA
jgi:ABC-type glutathione transport system ATPase component